MTELVYKYMVALWELMLEMSPYLLLGFFIAGLLYIYFPKEKVTKYLGKNNLLSTLNAALIGVPLPLCSCGVIPTGISFYKNGASKGSTVSFLISTPQTGVDSMMATYSLLGLPLAIIRPVIALITGIAGGVFTNAIENKSVPVTQVEKHHHAAKKHRTKLGAMMHYAFVEFLQDISKWLIIGLLLAAIMAVLIPDNFFGEYLGNEYLSMFIVLVASIPLYVCATGSVPIAAVLLMKGLSPGAAIVFLMAGPATNAATITVISKVMGRKTLITYLATIIGGAVIFGVAVNELLPRAWFTEYIDLIQQGHGGHMLPHIVKVVSALLLVALLINGYVQQYVSRTKKNNSLIKNKMEAKIVKVSGMTCNHCKANVENNLAEIKGISRISVELDTGNVTLNGDDIDLDEVKNKVESIGYFYEGEVIGS